MYYRTSRMGSILGELPEPPSDKTGWPWTEQSDPLLKAQSDGSPWPKISIVTPSYNQGAFLEKTLRSVLLQGYPNLQYIVIDGGSTDQSVEVIQKYTSWIDEWESKPDRGQSHAINKGMAQADGDIVAWLNSDDFYMPNALRHVARAFTEHPSDVGAIVGQGQKVDEHGNVGHTPALNDLSYDAFLHWMQGGNFMQPSCFMRRSVWEECSPLREDLNYCLDVDLWLKIADRFRFTKVDRLLSRALEHRAAKTIADRTAMRLETALLIAQHGGDEGMRIARGELKGMADGHRKFLRLINHPLYRWVVSPLYRLLK